jgi:copper chaperone CopZ
LQKLPGVAKVDLDADARTATVSVEAGTFSAADAVDALKSRGFPADTVKGLEFASAAGAKAPAADDAEAPAEDAEAPPTSAKDAETPAESTDAPAKEAKEE